MKAKNEIERWLKDEKFMAFANKRAKEEFFNSENNYIDAVFTTINIRPIPPTD